MDNLKAAARSLLSTPATTLVVAATLAIAIGANTAIFSVVDGVLLRPLGYGDDSRLVVLWSTNEGDTFRMSPADYMDVRDDVAAFGGQVALSRNIGSTLTALEQPVRVGSMAVTPRLFSVLRARPAAGQLFTPEDETPGGAPKVVITHASWMRRFGGDPGLVGRSIEIDGLPRSVVGITSPDFDYPPGNSEVEVYFPMALDNSQLPDRDHRMFNALARLDEGVSLAAARDELGAVAARLADEAPSTNDGWDFEARPLRDELFGELSTTLWVLSGAVFLVLLIACANIANLLVARSAAASREFAVRAALGAGKAELARRSLAESLILGGIGGGAGLLLALWGTALLRSLVPDAVPRADTISVNLTTLLFAAGISMGATALVSWLPALRGMAPDLGGLLNSGSTSHTHGSATRRLRELMVVAQVALAVVLLIGAGLMVRSFTRLSRVDPGFRQQGVVSVAVQIPRTRHSLAELRPLFEQLVERVRDLPGTKAAGAVSDLPMSNVGLDFELEFDIVGVDLLDPGARPNANVRLVLPGYFEAMGMRITRGRAFDAVDVGGDNNVVIINETIAQRYFRDLDPVGQSVRMDFGELDIIGVVSDIRHDGLLSKYASELYVPFGRPITTAEMNLVMKTDADPAVIAGRVGDALRDVDPQLAPSEVVALSDLLWESIAQPRFNTALLALLAACGAVLAIIGTYGIVAYTVSQRVREIGLRMALGADAPATVAMIVRHALGIVAAGAGLGAVGAVGAARLLRGQLFEVEPSDLLTWIVVLAAAVLVGILAAWLPARRATRIDPLAALRDG